MLYKTIENKEYKLYIGNDEYTSSPRDDDNLGIMVCNYGRYSLGDIKLDSHGETMLNDFAIHINNKYDICDIEDYCSLSNQESNKIWKWIEKNILYDILSLTNHSDIRVNIGHPKDRWDSGYIGYIYCLKDTIRKDFGIKNISESYKNKTYDIFKGEIETYNQYLSGNIYEYIFEEREIKIIDGKKFHTEWEQIDSCGGFYSLNDITDYINEDIFSKDEILNYNL